MAPAPRNNKQTSLLLKKYLEELVTETIIGEVGGGGHSVFPSSPKPAKKSGLRYYKITPPTQKIKKKLPAPARLHDRDSVDPYQRDFLVGVLKQLPKNATAQKILGGLPFSKKEVYVLGKQLIQSGMVPVKRFKELAKLLVLIGFDIQDNSL
jgi:hypothetical protein